MRKTDDKRECPHCGRLKVRGADEKKKLIHRLSRIEGQIRGLKNMVESDVYCIDILTQSAAAAAAIGAFNREILFEHIRTCVKDDIKAGKDESIDELMDIIKKMRNV